MLFRRRNPRVQPARVLDQRLKDPLERSHALWRSGQWESAAQSLTDTLRRLPNLRPFPDQAAVHVEVATFLASHQPAVAMVHARRAAELGRDDALTLTRVAWLMHDRGDRDTAREYMREACRAAPPQGFLLQFDLAHLRGKFAIEDGDAAEAQRFLEEAFTSAPNLVGLAADLADTYLLQGQRDKAAQVVAQGLHQFPDNARLRALSRTLSDPEV